MKGHCGGRSTTACRATGASRTTARAGRATGTSGAAGDGYVSGAEITRIKGIRSENGTSRQNQITLARPNDCSHIRVN